MRVSVLVTRLATAVPAPLARQVRHGTDALGGVRRPGGSNVAHHMLNKAGLQKGSAQRPKDDAELARVIVHNFKPASGAMTDHLKVRAVVQTLKDVLLEHHAIAGIGTYSAVIQVCARLRNPELAEKFFAEMQRDRGLVPSQHTIVSLASAYASVGRVRDVVALLDPTGYETHASMGVLLRAYAKAKMTSTMMRCFQIFVDRGFKATHRHFVVLMSGQSDGDDAYDLLVSMKNTYEIVPDTIVCNAALGVCIQGANAAAARRIMEYMKARGVKSNDSTYSTLAGIHAKGKNLEGIKKVAEAMTELNMPLTVQVYASYIRCCGYLVADGTNVEENVATAEAMMQQAVTDGHVHSHMIYTNMLEVLIMTKDDMRIRRLEEMMATMLVKPSRLFLQMMQEYRNRYRGEAPRTRAAKAAEEVERLDNVFRATMLPGTVGAAAGVTSPARHSSRASGAEDAGHSDADADAATAAQGRPACIRPAVHPARAARLPRDDGVLQGESRRGDFEDDAARPARPERFGELGDVRGVRRHMAMQSLGVNDGFTRSSRYWEDDEERAAVVARYSEDGDGVDSDGSGAARRTLDKRSRDRVSPVFDDRWEQDSITRAIAHGDARLHNVPKGELKVWAREDARDRTAGATQQTWEVDSWEKYRSRGRGAATRAPTPPGRTTRGMDWHCVRDPRQVQTGVETFDPSKGGVPPRRGSGRP